MDEDSRLLFGITMSIVIYLLLRHGNTMWESASEESMLRSKKHSILGQLTTQFAWSLWGYFDVPYIISHCIRYCTRLAIKT